MVYDIEQSVMARRVEHCARGVVAQYIEISNGERIKQSVAERRKSPSASKDARRGGLMVAAERSEAATARGSAWATRVSRPEPKAEGAKPARGRAWPLRGGCAPFPPAGGDNEGGERPCPQGRKSLGIQKYEDYDLLGLFFSGPRGGESASRSRHGYLGRAAVTEAATAESRAAA